MTELEINFSGETVDLSSFNDINFMLINTGTLSNNYVLNTSASFILIGSKITFYYKANVTKGAFNFNILGTNLSETQLKRQSTIEAVYNGTTWDLNITPTISASDSFIITIPISFETGEQSDNRVYARRDMYIDHAFLMVTKALSGTDSATVTLAGNNGVDVFKTFTIPASTIIGYEALDDVVCFNEWTTPRIYATGTKTTAGGKCLLTLTGYYL